MRCEWIVIQGFAAVVWLLGAVPVMAVPVLPACDGDRLPAGSATCVSTGDRGWDERAKWRLKDTKAPEIGGRMAGCRAEQVAGVRARDRLRVLMASGYTITFIGRSDAAGWPLVTMRLADGRDASSQLMSEGVVHASPNRTNRWCNPEKW